MSVSQRLLDLEGHRIAVIESGEDDERGEGRLPVLLLHDLGLSARFWPVNLPAAVLDGRRWASLSLPGHYPSVLPREVRPDDLAPAWWARYVAGAALASFGERPFVAVGYGVGAFAALATAALQPKRVAGVVAVSGGARGAAAGAAGLEGRLVRIGVPGRALFRLTSRTAPLSRALYAGLLRRTAAGPIDPARLDAALDAVLPDVRWQDPRALALVAVALRPLDLEPFLRRIAAPVLVVAGAEDEVVPLARQHVLARALRAAELVVLPEAGHLFFAEAFGEFDRATSAWLRRLDAQRAA